MTPRSAAFAIPGDINTFTGGYIYERRLLAELRDLGHDVQHVQLGASFPDPTPPDMDHAIAALVALPPARALILDGLVFGSIATPGLARVRAPIVAMIHHPLALETGLTATRRSYLFKTERANLALAAHVLVPSDHTARILAADYAVPRDRITIARPGTEPAAGTRMPTDPPLILSVGIQHPRKGHDIFLRALAKLKDHCWRAVIAGSVHDAAHARELEHLLDQLGLRDRVVLAGRIPQVELDRLFAEACFFALATHYEGYGMVFDEAQAWGLPIVTCNTGAVSHTVAPGAGLLVASGQPGPFAEAMASLLTDETLRQTMGEASLRAGATLPGWQDTARCAGRVLDGLEHQAVGSGAVNAKD